MHTECENRPGFKFTHFPALDGLRGIAVLIVMLYHLELVAPDLHMIVKGGFLGVDIFFVLSGFLITSILLKEYDQNGSISLRNFYIKRSFRLMPAFWLFLIVIFLFGPFLLSESQSEVIYSQNNFIYAFLYLMNWHAAYGGMAGNLNHTWSLAIEEQFYIIWSLLLFFAYKRTLSQKQIFIATCGLVALLLLSKVMRTLIGTSVDVLYYSTETRIDAILIGCIASMVYCWKLLPTKVLRTKTLDRFFVASFTGAFLIIFSVSHEDRILYYGLNSLFCTFVAVGILWLILREQTFIHSIFQFRLLCWIGKISYGLYLWHYLFYSFSKHYFTNIPIQIVVGICLSFLISALSFYLLELPILNAKNKWMDKKTPENLIPKRSLA